MSFRLYELQQTTVQGRGEAAIDCQTDTYSNSESDNTLKSSFFLFNVNFPTTAFACFMLIYLKKVHDGNIVYSIKVLYLSILASEGSMWAPSSYSCDSSMPSKKKGRNSGKYCDRVTK